MYTYATIIALLSAIAAAAPVAHQPAQGTVTLLIGLDLEGTAFSGNVEVPFRQKGVGVFPEQGASSLAVNTATGTPIGTEDIVCQAYSNAEASQVLGPTFDRNVPGVSLGNGDALVQIGSVYCSDAAGVAAFTAKNAAPEAAVPIPPQPAQGTVTLIIGVELNGDASRGNIVVPFREKGVGVFPDGASTAAVNFGTNTPSGVEIICQAYTNVEASQVLGPTFDDTIGGVQLGDGSALVQIGSVYCSDAAGVAAFTAKNAAPSA